MGIRYRMNPALGLPILSAVLRAAGHECEVIDLEAAGIGPDRLGAAFAAQRDKWPDVVGFTALTSSARGARESIAAIRKAGYGGKVIVGGPHATLAPEEALSWGADTVVVGECERNVVQALTTAGVVNGKPAPIDAIPAPDWSHHHPSPALYEGNAPHLGRPEGISMWSRGCPSACIFCGNPVFGGSRKRYRPVEAVAAEMADLQRRGVRSVFVYDDELIGSRLPAGWLADLEGRLAPLGLVWKTQGRCSARHVTPAVLQSVYRAGCRVVMWGVESFSQKVLDANKKGTTVDDIWTVLRASKAAGLKNWVFTMVGMYQETDEDAAMTAAALEQAYREGLIDYRQTTVCTVQPQTPLEGMAKEQGWFVQPPEAGPQMHQAYTSTPWMTKERIAYWLNRYAQACPVDYRGRAA